MKRVDLETSRIRALLSWHGLALSAHAPVELIAFQGYRDGDFEVFLVNPDGTNLRPLTENTELDGHPTWGVVGER